ncbi:MAG: hypothetical protein Q9186_001308 [Xanthomendoza sp. 1 TL-2023]
MYEYQIIPHDTAPDVKLFSESMVKYRLPRKADKLRMKVATEAAEKSEGMFLWIKLLEKKISPEQNAEELSQTVLEMPSGIIKELAEALIVSGDEELHKYPHDYLSDAWEDGFVDDDYVSGMILGRCGSLLELRSASRDEPLAEQRVHFVHFSVKGYLSNLLPADPLAKSLGLLDDETEEIGLSKICLRYLTLGVFREIPPATNMYPFLSYASWAWYFHGYRKRPLDSQDIVQCTQEVFDPSHSYWRVWTLFLEAELLGSDDQDGASVIISSSSRNEEGLDQTDPRPEPYTVDEISLLASVQTPIYHTFLLGLAEVVKWLEERGLDDCCAGGRFGFPLQAALARNQIEVVTHLLDRKVDVLQNCGQYGSAIVAAAATSTPEVVVMLLDKGVDVNSTDTTGWTALHHASARGSREIVEALYGRGAHIDVLTYFGSTAITLVCEYGSPDVVSTLLEKGPNLELASKKGEMPLHVSIINEKEYLATIVASVATEAGNLAALELLLKRGTLLNSIDESSQATLFDTAVLNNHDDIASFLVMNSRFQSGEATNTPRKLRRRSTTAAETGKDVIMMSFSHDIDAIKKLLQNEHGTATKQAGLDEALRVAVACGFTDVATLLLTNGARASRKDVNGRTALHHPIFNRCADLASILAEQGASLSMEDNIGFHPG